MIDSVLARCLIGLDPRLRVKAIAYLPLSRLVVLLATADVFWPMTSGAPIPAARPYRPLPFLGHVGTMISERYNQTDWSLALRVTTRAIVFISRTPFRSCYTTTEMWWRLRFQERRVAPHLEPRNGQHFEQAGP
ncbi:MAG: hypothetical protein ACKO1M_02105 [Planctomycetota bacterium]